MFVLFHRSLVTIVVRL